MAKINVPSVKERLTRVIMAGALVASMGASAAMPMAAKADTGSVTIAQTQNASATYNVYQLFTADITNDDKASHVEWNASLQSAVLTFLSSSANPLNVNVGDDSYGDWIEAQGYGHGTNGEATSADKALAQNAAEYIAEKINASSNDADAGTTPVTKAANTFADALAKALNGETATDTVATGTQFSNDEGYYLFVSDPSTVGTDEAGTAPMYIALGGSTNGTTVSAKEAIPTLMKQVKEDSVTPSAAVADSYEADEEGIYYKDDSNEYVLISDYEANPSGYTISDTTTKYALVPGHGAIDGYGKVADANTSQEVAFKLTGTVAQNIGAFSTYAYKITDTLPSGMTLENGDTSSVVVKIDGVDVTSAVASGISYANDVLTVDFTDLKAINTGTAQDPVYVSIDKDTVVTVDYNAHLDTDAALGDAAGNVNSTTLEYASNPLSLAEKDSTSADNATVYTYKLHLDKIDKQTTKALSGMVFTIQDSAGNYINANGEQVASAVNLTMSSDAGFDISGLDADVYTIHEVTPPTGYEAMDADIVLTIGRSLDQTAGNMVANSFSATITGGESDGSATVTYVQNTGVVTVTATDDHFFTMPLTGLEGNMAIYLVAFLLVAAAGAGFAVSRKKDGKKSEEGNVA